MQLVYTFVITYLHLHIIINMNTQQKHEHRTQRPQASAYSRPPAPKRCHVQLWLFGDRCFSVNTKWNVHIDMASKNFQFFGNSFIHKEQFTRPDETIEMDGALISLKKWPRNGWVQSLIIFEPLKNTACSTMSPNQDYFQLSSSWESMIPCSLVAEVQIMMTQMILESKISKCINF